MEPKKPNQPGDREKEPFEPSGDGMSTATAQTAIDRQLRKKIMKDYDLIDLEDKGRYYTAKASSKDGSRMYDLLIDKQTADIKILAHRPLRGDRQR